MAIRIWDRWRYPSRGSVEQALAYARALGSLRLQEVEAYLRELWRLCQKFGVDFSLAVAHSANETGDPNRGGAWLSPAWRDWLNPIGLGITDGGLDMRIYRSGVEAARAHFVHLWLYVMGEIPEGSELESYVELDPRYEDAIRAGYAGIAK